MLETVDDGPGNRIADNAGWNRTSDWGVGQGKERRQMLNTQVSVTNWFTKRLTERQKEKGPRVERNGEMLDLLRGERDNGPYGTLLGVRASLLKRLEISREEAGRKGKN